MIANDKRSSLQGGWAELARCVLSRAACRPSTWSDEDVCYSNTHKQGEWLSRPSSNAPSSPRIVLDNAHLLSSFIITQRVTHPSSDRLPLSQLLPRHPTSPRHTASSTTGNAMAAWEAMMSCLSQNLPTNEPSSSPQQSSHTAATSELGNTKRTLTLAQPTPTAHTYEQQLSLVDSAAKAAATGAVAFAARDSGDATAIAVEASTAATLAASQVITSLGATIPQDEVRKVIVDATNAALANIPASAPSAAARPAAMPRAVEKITSQTHPHIFQAIRASAPYSVELAFRKAFHEEPLHPAIDWPNRVVLARPDGVKNTDTPPELSGPNGELVIPADPNNYFSRPRNYTDFARLIKANRHALRDVHVLDIIDDIGRQGARPILRATPKLEVIRFIPERLLFTSRTWAIHVDKVVVCAKIPLPLADGTSAQYFPWRSMLRLIEPTKVRTLVLNVTFLDNRPAIADAIPQEDYQAFAYHVPENVVIIFANPHASKSQPARLKSSYSERQTRFRAICDAVIYFVGRQLMPRHFIRTVTLVGIDNVNPAMFGFAANQIASREVHNYLHQRGVGHICCPATAGGAGVRGGRGAVPHRGMRGRGAATNVGGHGNTPAQLRFFSLEQYATHIGAANYAVETVW